MNKLLEKNFLYKNDREIIIETNVLYLKDTFLFDYLVILMQGRIQEFEKGGGTTYCFFSDRRQPRNSRKSQKSW